MGANASSVQGYAKKAEEIKRSLDDQIHQLRGKVDESSKAEQSQQEPAFHDLEIVAGNRIIPAAKSELQAKCPGLTALLLTELKDNVLEVNADPDAVEAVLKFISTRKMVEDVELAKKVLDLADRLNFWELKDHCELFFVDNTTPFNADDLYELACNHKLPVLRAHCLEILFFHSNDTLDDLFSMGEEAYVVLKNTPFGFPFHRSRCAHKG